MNPAEMDPVYSEALRTTLIERVATATPPFIRRHRRLWFGTGVFAGTCVLGGAVAVATGLLPLPGGQAITDVAAPVTQTHSGTATVEMGSPPSDATNVSLTLACLSAGTFFYPDGASMSCSPTDAGSPTGVSFYSLPLTSGEHGVTIKTAADDRWRLTAEYVQQTTTAWKVNANGQTYGVENSQGTPDLLAVVATNGLQGYVETTALDAADGTTASRHFTSPAQALQWQASRAGKSFEIPVYDSDGTTVIGEFVIGG